MGVCNCSMFCCMLLCVRSGIAIILMGKRGLISLLNLSSWCLVMVERLFLVVLRGCLQFVIVVFPDNTHLLFFCNCSMFCFELIYVHSSNAIILIGMSELVALLSLSLWFLMIVVWFFLAMPWVCMQFVFVVFPDHIHLLFFLVIFTCFYSRMQLI